MNKYTINKAFEKHFHSPIWKIEVDCANHYLAVEHRNPESTMPGFAVIRFDGSSVLEDYAAAERSWTLEAIQGDFLIFKRMGSASPIQSGIQVVHIPSRSEVFVLMEYVLKEVYVDQIKVAHRAVPSGLEYFVDIHTGAIQPLPFPDMRLPVSNVSYPVPYQGQIPHCMQALAIEDQAWLQPYDDIFIWSYHTRRDQYYDLHLSLSSKQEILDSTVVLHNLDKLIPQPYFRVKEYIFFLSNTKQEIAAYLV